MKKLSIVVLLIGLFSMTAIAVHAGDPPTIPYLVFEGRNCRLPDATGRPQETVESKIQRTELAEDFIRMDCVGQLPAGSRLPKAPLKLAFSDTKIYCATWYGENLLLSTDYGATVMPNGTAEISCVFFTR